MEQTDYLIIGSGIAGLSLAIHLATRFPDKKITILTKSDESKSNTQFAQGGIAVVTDLKVDSFEKHIEDTLICGSGICDKQVVEKVVQEGPKRLQEIINWGARFDKKNNHELDLGKEGGHSENRVVHHKDQTGHEMVNAMLTYIQDIPNIHLINHRFAIDLICTNNTCFGAIILNETTNEIITYSATYTILATGGIGQVFGHTTNSEIATGDGIALAANHHALISDMEFIQFHPTALFSKELSTTFLISEAVRGFGAYLRTKDGNRFMSKYDNRMELAPRDIVSQSIYTELKLRQEECVYLDCTHLEILPFKKHFPKIYEQCKSLGIQIEKDWIPVAPSQHYLCGGININSNGESSIENLFVCGESARTGLHGANRLASNSLLEALVYSHAIFEYLSNKTVDKHEHGFDFSVDFSTKQFTDTKLITEARMQVNQIMMQYVGIVRTDKDLLLAKEKMIAIQTQIKPLLLSYYPSRLLYELNNMITVGLLIIEHSLSRATSIGTFVKTC
jgi:L-aspartate oxidase